MFYTAFSLEVLTKEAIPKVIAAICHEYGGCECDADCDCKLGKSCETCHYTHRSADFDFTVVSLKGGIMVVITTRPKTVMQVEMYTEQQFDFYGLRELVETLKGYTQDGQIRMIHLHRDYLTGENPPA